VANGKKQSGDSYIYDAVKKGSNPEEPLPEEIEQGIKDVSKRTEWNKPAASILLCLPKFGVKWLTAETDTPK
jgi:hypothetical protein